MTDRLICNYRNFLYRTVFFVLLISCPFIRAAGASPGRAVVRIWDTVSPLANEADIQNRTNWKLVPENLFLLELQPATAASDPGYYGREYAFGGDAVVENEHFIVVFRSKTGKATVYPKADSGKKIFELTPLQFKNGSAKITRCRVLRNTGNEAALEIFFSAAGNEGDLSAIFSIDKTEIIEVEPAPGIKGMSVVGSIAYGVVPDFISDDLIFDPGKYPSTEALSIPSENMFLGLLEGEKSVLVMTWPQGGQKTKLLLSGKRASQSTIDSVDFDNDGKSFYLAVLSAPGIWHRADLKLSYLEKDVDMGWQRPFPAKWTMQLEEAGVRTTFTFKESEGSVWRAVIGHYTYPVWFQGNEAFCRLSKKIPPKGQSVIYCLEGRDTPASITTPVDVLKQTLGRQACESILDYPGRVLRTHHRRGAEGVRRACTCGCTEAIETVFKAHQEVERAEYIKGAVGDMVYFVTRHVERINEYRKFADDLMKFLDATRKSSPDLKPYLDEIQEIAREIPQEYATYKENMKSLAYADELARKTKALTQKDSPGNLPACLELGKLWRGMGGSQDNVVGFYHSITRKLDQEAGYRCVDRPDAVEVAKEIRRRCRQCLRHADGYEIGPNY